MPQQTFEVTAPDGRTVEITGEKMPTGAQLQAIFAKLPPAEPPAKPNPLERMGPGYRDPMAGMPREYSMEGLRQVGRNTKAMAPALGAMAATALVPPLAAYTVPAALAGGTAGALVRGDAPMDAVKRGGIEGAIEGGGQIAKQLLRMGASRLYAGLLKVPARLKEAFPDVAQQLLEAGRPISRGGAQAAEEALDASVSKADAMIDAAGAGGARPVQAMDIVPQFGEVSKVTKNRMDIGVVGPEEFKKILERVHTIVDTASRGGGIDVRRAQELKRTAQKAAEGAYLQMQVGNKGLLDTEDLLNAAVARGLKEAIELRVPGVKEANALSQKLLGQLEALNKAVGRTENHLPWGSVSDLAAMGAGTVTGSPAVGLASKALTFAPVASRVAIGANELGKRNAATAVRIGQLVWVGGKQQRVLSVNEDGTFEAVPAPGAKR